MKLLKCAILVLLLTLICCLPSSEAADLDPDAEYQITRWEWNPDSNRLELDVSDLSGNLVRTYRLPPNFDRTSFYVKAIQGRTQFNVPDGGWQIDCDPSKVQGISKRTGKKVGANPDGGVRFFAGDTVFFKTSTGMSIVYLNEAKRLKSTGKDDRPIINPMPLIDGARYRVTKCAWDSINEKFLFEIRDKKNKPYKFQSDPKNMHMGDNYKKDNSVIIKGIPAGTQFTIPEGWYIDCYEKTSKSLQGVGEPLYRGGGIRYREGDTVLFTKSKSEMTIRQLYVP